MRFGEGKIKLELICVVDLEIVLRVGDGLDKVTEAGLLVGSREASFDVLVPVVWGGEMILTHKCQKCVL